jgi:ribosomal protein L29
MKGKVAFMKDLHDKTLKELVHMRREAKKELYSYKMKHAIK